MSLSVADLKIVGGVHDYLGGDAVGLGDTDADGLPDLLISAPGSSLGGDNAGAAFLLSGGGALLSGLGGS